MASSKRIDTKLRDSVNAVRIRVGRKIGEYRFGDAKCVNWLWVETTTGASLIMLARVKPLLRAAA